MELVIRTAPYRDTLTIEGSSRVAAPLPDERLPVLPKRLWWVERLAGRDLLRLAGRPTRVEVVGTRHMRSVWEAGRRGFERISRPGVPSSPRVEVAGLPRETPLGVEVHEIETGPIITSLEKAQLTAAVSTVGWHAAAARMRPLIASLARRSRQDDDPLAAVRRFLTMEEIVRPGSTDPYAFAASLLSQALALPAAVPFASLRSSDIRIDGSREARQAWYDDADRGSPAHQRLLRRLVEACEAGGWSPTFNEHVDARIVEDDSQILFEVKTADERSFRQQLRLAIGQLLDYRHRYGEYASATRLCIVIDDVPRWRREARCLVTCLGMYIVLATRSELRGLPEVLASSGDDCQ